MFWRGGRVINTQASEKCSFIPSFLPSCQSRLRNVDLVVRLCRSLLSCCSPLCSEPSDRTQTSEPSERLHFLPVLHALSFLGVPDPHSRVVLKSKSCNDLLSSYINANYIRVSRTGAQL